MRAARLGLGVMALYPGHARAADTPVADCSSGPDACDLQLRSTMIRSVLWKNASSSQGCSVEAWNALPKERFPKGTKDGATVLVSGVRAPTSFLNGVCEFHRKSGGRANGDADRGIAELQAAQQGRLMPAQRQAAGLFEGLLHCRKLDDVLKRYGDDWTKLEQVPTAKREFCEHRAQARASLGNMNWVGFELGYDSKDWSLYQHIDALSACAASYLHNSYDAACQIRSQMSVDEARAVGQKAATQVLAELLGGEVHSSDSALAEGPITAGRVDDFFGGKGNAAAPAPAVPPITAIMARKLSTAREAVDGASGRFDSLRSSAAALTGSVESLSGVMSQIGGAATTAAQTYEEAVRTAQEIVRFVDYWVKGFFQDSRGKDVRDALGESRHELLAARQGVEGVGASEGLVVKLDAVQRKMEQLSQGSDREAGFLRHLCAVYFCEIQGRTADAGLTASACSTFDSNTGKQYSASNDLCLATGNAAARTLCSGVGFTAFTNSNADACVSSVRAR